MINNLKSKIIKRVIEILESNADDLKFTFSENGKHWESTDVEEDYKEYKKISEQLKKLFFEESK